MGSIQLDTASGRDRSRAFVKIIASAAVATGFCVFCLSNASAADEKERSADPLGDIAQDMKAASRWLGKLSTDVLTQETQKDAVDKLDVLIAELEKQAQQFKAGQSSPNPQAASRFDDQSGPWRNGKTSRPQRRRQALGRAAAARTRTHIAIDERRISGSLSERVGTVLQTLGGRKTGEDR